MKYYGFLLFSVCWLRCFGEEIVIDFDQESITDLRGDEEIQLRFNLTWPQQRTNGGSDISLSIQCADTDLCSVKDQPIVLFSAQNGVYKERAVVVIEGLFLGHTELLFSLGNRSNFVLSGVPDPFPVAVLRTKQGKTLSTIFTVVISVFVVINTFMMGTQLEVAVIIKVLKQPIGPSIGFFCQYIVMPVIAFGWAFVILSGLPSLQFGFFAVGCSPGGGQSNFWTILLDGNIDLSVTMTFFSNLAALVMMPAWLYTAGTSFYTGSSGIVIPFFNILAGLALLIVPLCLGIAFITYRPHLAKKFRRAIKIMSLIFLVLILPFAIWQGLYIFRLMRWYTLLCGALLPWCGYALAYMIAFALRQSHADCRTIAVETGIQNGSIAIILCRFSLQEPDSDLTLVMPVCTMMFTALPLWVMFFIRFFLKRTGRLQATVDVKPESEKPTNEPVASVTGTMAKADAANTMGNSVGSDNPAFVTVDEQTTTDHL